MIWYLEHFLIHREVQEQAVASSGKKLVEAPVHPVKTQSIEFRVTGHSLYTRRML